MKLSFKRKTARVLRTPKSTYLALRTAKKWGRIGRVLNPLGILSQVSPGEYKTFVSSFHPAKTGEYTLQFTRGSTNSALILTLSKTTTRTLSSILFGRPKEAQLAAQTGTKGFFSRIARRIKIPGSYNLFKTKLTLTREIEPNVALPIDRTKGMGVCAIIDLIGPTARKYKNTQEIAREANETLGTNWQNYLLREITAHAEKQGCSAVALLRPENNPDLTNEHLARAGVNEEGAKSIRSHYFAAARKAGFRKVEGSKYFWKFF